MKIKRIHIAFLRNEEWFQFYSAFRAIVLKYGPQQLDIEELFAAFVTLLDEADAALEVIRRSAVTEQIVEADAQRDHIFRGLVDHARSFANHFDPDKREAARTLDILFKHYGNLARKPLNEETAGIHNFVQDLNGAYLSQVERLGIGDWVSRLAADNDAFDALWLARNAEIATWPQRKVKDIRHAVQDVYARLTERIEAAITFRGEADFAPFVNEVNAAVKSYNDAVAQRKGQAQRKKNTEK